MKKKLKWFITFLTLILMVGSLTACGDKADDPTNDGQVPTDMSVPDEVQAVKDKVITLAADNASKLNGEFGDKHAALVASGQGRDYADYAAMLEQLKAIQEETGAYYVYTLIDADPNDEGFNVIVDASEEPDDYMYVYELEGQFTDAMNGIPAAALSAWDDGDEDLCWSAFAPIYDSEGNIVAILGVDYPCPEIKDFPEWNRDSDQWNGMHY